MRTETKNCQSCKKDFKIEAEDFAYYGKIGVSVPRLCPICREQRRQVFRNERTLYKRPCDLCKKPGISVYSPDKKDIVYCTECWWSDKWNPLDYGKAYDLSRPFFDQFAELWAAIPKMALAHARSVNSEYINMAADTKNCYMIFESSNNEDCIHCYWIQKSRSSTDCSYTHEVEFSYESDDCYESSRLFYSKGCHQCLDSYFLLDSKGCSNCIASINLRNKQYCIFNKQVSKAEYDAFVKEARLDTYSGVEALRKKFQAFIAREPRKYAEVLNTENCTGNYIKNAKNCKQCFHSYDAQDNKYSTHVWREAKDCWDCHTVGRNAELVYNSTNNGIEASNCICCTQCWGGVFLQYCLFSFNAMNCFGCAGARKQKYCILNKQYSKEEYEELRGQIIESMKKEGIYGEFYPPLMSSFGYNESAAFLDKPLSKEEAVAQGFKWEDAQRGIYNQETVRWDAVPDSINDIGDLEVTKQIFACLGCKKNYRVITAEFEFYKHYLVPLPRLCPDCRLSRRLHARGPNQLWHRQCLCVRMHEHHMTGRCVNEFETTFAPDRPEIIYCEQCYQQEVV